MKKDLKEKLNQVGQVANSMKSPGGSKLFPFTDDGDCCANWDLPRISALIHCCLRGLQFLGFRGFVCALACTVNYVVFYRRVCAFPNHV